MTTLNLMNKTRQFICSTNICLQLQNQNNVTMDVTRYHDNTMMDVSRPSEMKRVDHTIMDNVTRPFNFHDNNKTANITEQKLLFYKVEFPFLEHRSCFSRNAN